MAYPFNAPPPAASNVGPRPTIHPQSGSTNSPVGLARPSPHSSPYSFSPLSPGSSSLPVVDRSDDRLSAQSNILGAGGSSPAAPSESFSGAAYDRRQPLFTAQPSYRGDHSYTQAHQQLDTHLVHTPTPRPQHPPLANQGHPFALHSHPHNSSPLPRPFSADATFTPASTPPRRFSRVPSPSLHPGGSPQPTVTQRPSPVRLGGQQPLPPTSTPLPPRTIAPLPARSSIPVPAQPQAATNTFVRQVMHSYGFSDDDTQIRAHLEVLLLLGSGLSQPDLTTRLYMLAGQFYVARMHQAQLIAHEKIQATLLDIGARLDEYFSLTKEQTINIRIIALDTIFDCDRINFMHLYADIERRISQDRANLKLLNIYGNPAREKFLLSHLKRVASSARNALRTELHDHVGSDAIALDQSLLVLATRFKRLPPGCTLPPRYRDWLAILRRFTHDNYAISAITENEESQADTNDDTPSPDNRAAKKRKLNNGRPAAKPPKGDDFWSLCQGWFTERQKQWGTQWTDEGWKKYIDETVRRDLAQFKPQILPSSQYMEDEGTRTLYEAYALPSMSSERPNTTPAASHSVDVGALMSAAAFVGQ